MALISEYYSPAELTDASRVLQARQAGSENPKLRYNFTTDYFRPSYVPDLDYRVTPGRDGVPSSASFRAWDTQNPLGVRPGFDVLSGELLPLGQRELFTEADRLRIRQADPVQFQGKLAEAAKRTTMATVVRMERAAVDTALTGKTTITDERGVTQEADWGRNVNRATTATVLWSLPATSKPLDDLRNAREVVDQEVDILMSRPTYNLMLRSASWAAIAYVGIGGPPAGMPSVITDAYITSTLSAFGVGNLAIYDAAYRNAAGVETRILPLGKVLLIARGAGSAVWGVTAEAMDPAYGIQASAWPGIVTAHHGWDQPKQEWVNTAAVGFPVLSLPDDTYALTVTA